MCEYIFDGNFKYIKLIGTLIGCAITFAGMIIYFVGGGEIRAQRNTVLLSIFIGMAIGGAVGAVCAMHAYLDKKPDLLLIPLLWESLMIVALCIGLCYYGWQ
jgi:NAD/NADP transhydrogenase beta subunit